jgi:mannose-1-phosphate guanylyltransferase/mannose-6-phosphate isomerase
MLWDNVSIDYGIMEKSIKLRFVRLDQKWSDLGNFAANYDELENDSVGNVIHECTLCFLTQMGIWYILNAVNCFPD